MVPIGNHVITTMGEEEEREKEMTVYSTGLCHLPPSQNQTYNNQYSCMN